MGLTLEDSILAWIGPWALGVDAWTCHESPPIWETVFLIELLKATLIAKCLIPATASPSDFSEDSPVKVAPRRTFPQPRIYPIQRSHPQVFQKTPFRFHARDWAVPLFGLASSGTPFVADQYPRQGAWIEFKFNGMPKAGGPFRVSLVDSPWAWSSEDPEKKGSF